MTFSLLESYCLHTLTPDSQGHIQATTHTHTHTHTHTKPWGLKESFFQDAISQGQTYLSQGSLSHEKELAELFISKHSESVSHLVVSNSLQPHGLLSARLLCPWDSPGKNTGWVAISFSRGSSRSWIEPTSPHCRQIPYHLSHQGSPNPVTISKAKEESDFPPNDGHGSAGDSVFVLALPPSSTGSEPRKPAWRAGGRCW